MLKIDQTFGTLIDNRKTIVILLIVVFSSIFFHDFYADELENIYASYFVSKGLLPYNDFFQHHQPLLWYITAPLFLFTSDPMIMVFLFRLFNTAIIFSSLFILCKLKKNKWGFFLFFSTITFIHYLSYIRPEPLLMFFLLLSVFFISKKNYYLSGMALALSFSTHLLSVFFIFAIMVVFFFENKISKKLLKLSVGFLIGLLPLVLIISKIGVSNYYFWNITFNNIYLEDHGSTAVLRSMIHLLVTLPFIFLSLKGIKPHLKKEDKYMAGLIIAGVVSTVYMYIATGTIRLHHPYMFLITIPLIYFIPSFSTNKKRIITFIVFMSMLSLIMFIRSATPIYPKLELAKELNQEIGKEELILHNIRPPITYPVFRLPASYYYYSECKDIKKIAEANNIKIPEDRKARVISKFYNCVEINKTNEKYSYYFLE